MSRPLGLPRPEPGLITIVIPAKDEAEAIGETLGALPLPTLRAQGHEVEVLVLDGNSQDATADIARSWGARVVLDRSRGKGAALRNARGQFRGDYIVMLDADGTYAADAIPRILDPLARDEADIAMGNRRIQAGAMNGTHRVGNVMLSLAAQALFAQRCPDLCTGLWGFRAEALRLLPLQSRGFELEAELFALSNRMNLRIAHAPVDYLPRKGKSKLNATDAIRIGWWLLRTRFVAMPLDEAYEQPSGGMSNLAGGILSGLPPGAPSSVPPAHPPSSQRTSSGPWET